jgi:hypothetical protein
MTTAFPPDVRGIKDSRGIWRGAPAPGTSRVCLQVTRTCATVGAALVYCKC